MCQPHDRLLVQVGVEETVAGGLVDELAETAVLVLDAQPQPLGQVRVTPGGDYGLQEQPVSTVQRVEQVVAQHREDLGRGAQVAASVQDAVDGVGHVVVDRLQQKLCLAAVAGVDGAGRDPGPTGDLGHPGLLVALLGEHLGCGLQEPVGQPASGVLLRLGPVGSNGSIGCHNWIITVVIDRSSTPAGNQVSAREQKAGPPRY